jgi:N-carbamoylputrescine amidase
MMGSMDAFDLVVRDEPLPTLFRLDDVPPRRLRVGAVQCAWHLDPVEHADTLRAGVARAADHGAQVVVLQELTLSPYFCVAPDVDDALDRYGEELDDGPTITLARQMAAAHGIDVHASLYERTADGRGFNTAICVDASGRLLSTTRKTHIPEFEYYHEDRYFEPADTDAEVVEVAGARFAFPTCWDQWFPELARSLSMAGAEVIVYPTAIGSEPHVPDVDTQPMWHQMIVANGLANATFMVAVNRIGTEGPITFYGSSFVSDPYGRVVVEASRDRPAVLVAELELSQRDDWLSFGLLYTRRPARYRRLLETTDLGRPRRAPPERRG